MKANLFPQAEVASAMNDLVLLELYTDGSDEQSRQNQDLEVSRFNTVAIPFYATLDPDEKVLATFLGLTKNPQEYFAFLRRSAKPDEAAARSASEPEIRGVYAVIEDLAPYVCNCSSIGSAAGLPHVAGSTARRGEGRRRPEGCA